MAPMIVRRIGWVGLLIILVAVGFADDGQDQSVAKVGEPAPVITFTTVEGDEHQLSDFQGKPVMLWLVATWCPTCKRSASALGDHIDEVEHHGLRLITLRIHENLGYGGASIEDFREEWASSAWQSPNWLWGHASQRASRIYDPKGKPDIYWLIDPEGTIRAKGTAPNVEMDRILEFARSHSQAEEEGQDGDA